MAMVKSPGSSAWRSSGFYLFPPGILAGGHAGDPEIARFRIEAEAIAQLQHPHIVQVYEVGEQNGCPFLSLEPPDYPHWLEYSALLVFQKRPIIPDNQLQIQFAPPSIVAILDPV